MKKQYKKPFVDFLVMSYTDIIVTSGISNDNGEESSGKWTGVHRP